jgi:hypothetical protein
VADDVRVPLGTDWEVDLDLSALDQLTRQLVEVAGETLTFFFAATASGAAINAGVSITLTDLGNGRYYGFVPGASMTTHLASYAGQQIYPRLSAGSSRLDAVFGQSRYIVAQVAEVAT